MGAVQTKDFNFETRLWIITKHGQFLFVSLGIWIQLWIVAPQNWTVRSLFAVQFWASLLLLLYLLWKEPTWLFTTSRTADHRSVQMGWGVSLFSQWVVSPVGRWGKAGRSPSTIGSVTTAKCHSVNGECTGQFLGGGNKHPWHLWCHNLYSYSQGCEYESPISNQYQIWCGRSRQDVENIIRAAFLHLWMVVSTRGCTVHYLDCSHQHCQHPSCPLLCKA